MALIGTRRALLGGNGYPPGYYVDAVSGSDSASGTSPSLAWKTIAKVNAASFAPGDHIYFKRGQTWREQLTVPSAGSAGSPITFSAYGSGAKPIITGADFESWSAYDGIVQQQLTNTFTNTWFGYNSAHAWIANEYTSSDASFSVTSVTFWLQQFGTIASGKHVWVEIWNDSSGTPGSLITNGTSATVLANGVDKTTGQQITFTFASPPAITKGTKYYFVLKFDWTLSTTNYMKALGAGSTSPFKMWYITTDLSSKTSYTDQLYMIVNSAIPLNTYQYASAVVVNYVLFGGSYVGLPAATIELLTTAYAWYAVGKKVIVYSTTSPNPSVEVGQRDYAISVPDKSNITIDSLNLYGANGLANLLVGAGAGSSGVVVQNCEIHHGKQTGLYLWGVNGGVSQNNYIHHIWNGYPYGNGSDTGQGITIYDTPSINNIIRWNKIEANFRGVFIYGAAGAASPTGTVIEYNLVLNNLVNGIDQFQTNAASSPTLVYGNTVIHNPMWQSGHGIDIQDTGGDGISIENNIMYSSFSGTNTNVELVSLSSSIAMTSVNINNNLYYLSPGSTAQVAQDNSGTRYTSLASWKTYLSSTSYSGKDASSVSGDPIFVSASDYSLQLGSPAIASGANLGAGYSQGLAQGSTWPGGVSLANQPSSWAIGAYPR